MDKTISLKSKKIIPGREPQYLEINGIFYEKLDYPTLPIELDFSEKELETIKEATKVGGYISVPEFLRSVLAQKCREEGDGLVNER